MELTTIQTIALITSLVLLFAQLLVRQKQTYHLLFAVFCGSIAISFAKELSGESIGAYKYLIGMTACATCNCYWLLARSLFREKNSIAIHHILLAGIIALLIMMNQGYLFASNAALITASDSNVAQHMLRELTILLSSCILVLSFWEGCRGFSKRDTTEKSQRVLFLCTFGGAVAISKITQGLFPAEAVTQEMIKAFIVLFVLLNTQILVFWHAHYLKNQLTQEKCSLVKTTTTQVTNNSPAKAITESNAVADETLLAEKVKALIAEKALFLTPNLKIADVARRLEVPEYRVSNALRHNLHARNFNQYVNELRIKHAQNLLADSSNNNWPVLVIGLESGFASVGPFTRAFKTITGYTPNQYRQKYNQPKSA